MCYHTALIASPVQLALRFDRKADLIGDFRPVYHVSAFAHLPCPVVTDDVQLQPMRWGLIPFWTAGVEEALAIRNRTANARSETVFTKPAFRDSVRRRRCLVPVSGFFEWRHEGGRTTPFYITVPGIDVFALAGLYDRWRNPATGEWVATYSVLTTRANAFMRRIHNTNPRMPVMLAPDEERLWIDPALTPARAARLMSPFPSDALAARAVRPDFLRKAPSDPTVLQPA